jgi:septum formation protein
VRLILASNSPRRAEILRTAGIPFEVRAANIDEAQYPSEAPGEYVRRLAEAKARAAAAKFGAEDPRAAAIIIGADTTVEIDGAILAKPQSDDDARQMLERLSGRAHEVYTGVALLPLPAGDVRVFEEITRVEFAPLSVAEIRDYVASGESSDKAGGYAIQGLAGKFVRRIEGCHFNVMGLPLARVYSELKLLGWSPAARDKEAV